MSLGYRVRVMIAETPPTAAERSAVSTAGGLCRGRFGATTTMGQHTIGSTHLKTCIATSKAGVRLVVSGMLTTWLARRCIY